MITKTGDPPDLLANSLCMRISIYTVVGIPREPADKVCISRIFTTARKRKDNVFHRHVTSIPMLGKHTSAQNLRMGDDVSSMAMLMTGVERIHYGIPRYSRDQRHG